MRENRRASARTSGLIASCAPVRIERNAIANEALQGPGPQYVTRGAGRAREPGASREDAHDVAGWAETA
jgi:hypothetical protein